MKLIDFYKRGNVVRFYLGADNCEDYCGDDWDDKPYEHNAGIVYDEYIAGYMDVAFPLDFFVTAPEDDWRNGGNSAWSKEDMKNKRVPCIVIDSSDEYYFDNEFTAMVASLSSIKFYFEDDYTSLLSKIKNRGTIIGGENIE